MLIFGLRSTSDDQLNNLSNKCQPKCKKQEKAPNVIENIMFNFGLCSTSDDWLTDLNDEHRPKCKKNEKRPHKLSKNKMLIFG